MSKYKVVKPFIHLGKSVKAGQIVEMKEKQAKYLQLAGKVRLPPVKKAKPTRKKRKSKGRGAGKSAQKTKQKA